VELSSTEAGSIYEFDKEHKELQLRSSCGMSEELIQPLKEQHLGAGEPVIARQSVGASRFRPRISSPVL
jgi:hypothetical protein